MVKSTLKLAKKAQKGGILAKNRAKNAIYYY